MPSELCQSCHRPQNPEALAYRKGEARVSHASFLQCDVCERLLCSACLQIYDILSGEDFLCSACAAQLPSAVRESRSGARPPR